MKDKKACIFYFLMSIILLDFGNQIRKISSYSYMSDFKNPIFEISHVNNTGSAFSILKDNTTILIVFGIVALLMIAYYVYKKVHFNDKLILLSLTVFTGGSLGNLLERINFGYVNDYIKLKFIDFPVFNAFDIMICIGVFLFTFCIIFDKQPSRKIENDNNSN